MNKSNIVYNRINDNNINFKYCVAIYIAATLINIVFAVMLAKKLPDDRQRQSVPYGQLLRTIAGAVAGSRPAQVTLPSEPASSWSS
ncbi:hypothetical protein DKP76_16560 [Falsochrobactrum shanghaiense]|uniref:Uncharacterized protein n=1 Tax=Falsochrobactrum shanghaiense TaxID=2201899 RepID=A0A316J746_9HYPH|nr:hypothetical protein DKP76_16560 [Falsochrobactrum shanghaiense]